MNLYLTGDKIGTPTGGGSVTHHESNALRYLDPAEFQCVSSTGNRPPTVWDFDEECARFVEGVTEPIRLAHIYAGCFTKTVAALKRKGALVTYTAAAHDVAISRREHELLGLPYDYPHLTDPEQLERYLGGYLNASTLIVPSRHSMAVMEAFGATNPIYVIPHGTHAVEAEIKPLPATFTVGYLGAIGPDKGLPYLLQAWKRLNWSDAELLIAGPQSQHPWMTEMISRFGGGRIRQLGWVEHIKDFYNSISLYCQCSCSEGFGCEVPEALSYGRSVLASTTCGASDVVLPSRRYPYQDVGLLAGLIDLERKDTEGGIDMRAGWRAMVKDLHWPKIEKRYADLWRDLLRGKSYES